MASFDIKTYEFSEYGKRMVEKDELGTDWPVVYLIHNDKEMYVGETQNAARRFENHLSNQERLKLNKINIIFDNQFNKSAILDIEQRLIQLCVADKKYELQNRNAGQSVKHNYYQRERYVNKLESIWSRLYQMRLVDNDYESLVNSDIFKYSPYNSLTYEQNEISKRILADIIDKLSNNNKGISMLHGTVGTGKTIVMINMIHKLINSSKVEIALSEELDEELTENMELIRAISSFIKENGELSVAYVVPMTSARETLKKVFRATKNGLKADMVVSPYDIMKNPYDVVFIDEGHRLAQYKNISNRGIFKENATKMGKDPNDITQLDMILSNSKYVVMVYDENQTVKGSDITNEQLNKAIGSISKKDFFLTTQMRCAGSNLYIDYIKNIFNCVKQDKEEIEGYELKLFTNVDSMVNKIKNLDKEYGLCRNAAGYSWQWISKGHSYEDAVNNDLYDIKIGDYKYIWNMTNKEFIISENAINEIGCIHTTQGYDLNYAGIILGYEIDYNPITNKIEIDLDKFYDTYVKQGSSKEQVDEYIKNSYRVMLSRGIKGTYVYACNKNMQEYLKKFMEVVE